MLFLAAGVWLTALGTKRLDGLYGVGLAAAALSAAYAGKILVVT